MLRAFKEVSLTVSALLTAASEVSSILESRIAGTAVGANVEETGRVLSTLFFSSPRPSLRLMHHTNRRR